LVAITWLIREIGQREGGVDLEQLALELLCLHLADSLPGRRRQSAWASVCLVCPLFVRIRSLIHLVSCFWLLGLWRTFREERVDSPSGANGPRVGYGLSIFWGVLLVVQEAFSDSPQ
jgi:hypothetical protein